MAKQSKRVKRAEKQRRELLEEGALEPLNQDNVMDWLAKVRDVMPEIPREIWGHEGRVLKADIFIHTDNKDRASAMATKIAAALLIAGRSEQETRERLERWNDLLGLRQPEAELERADIRRIVKRAATYRRRASR